MIISRFIVARYIVLMSIFIMCEKFYTAGGDDAHIYNISARIFVYLYNVYIFVCMFEIIFKKSLFIFVLFLIVIDYN